MGACFDANGKDKEHERNVASTTGEAETQLAKQQGGKQHTYGIADLE